MNKIHHKRVNNINNNNNNNYYNNYYKYYNKKNYSKNNNNIKQNSMNNYNEEWTNNNNYYNNNNFNNFDNYNQYNDYSYRHSNKKNKYNKHYNNNNNNNNNFDDNITDDNMSKSTNDSKQKNNELLKIKINTKDNEVKELIIYKDEDIESTVNSFCNDNNIDRQFVIPLCNKINQSINEINFVTNNLELNKDDIMLLNNAKKISQNM